MNKRGGFVFYALILLVLAIGFAVTANAGFNVDTFKAKANWTDVNLTISQSPDLSHAAESLINGMGEALISVMKWAAEWAAQNPTIPWKLCIIIVLFAVLAPIIYYLFMIIVASVLMIKEAIVKRREKRELNYYREIKKERIKKAFLNK